MSGLDLDTIEEIISKNQNEFHRRLFLLEGNGINSLIKILSTYIELKEGKISLLLSGKEEKSEADWVNEVLNSLSRYFKEGIIQWGYVSFKDLDRIMGTTWDVLVSNFRVDFRPNDLGRLVEVVRGGGLLIFLIPERDKWRKMILPFHRDMISDPFSEKDLKPIFLKHFIDSLESAKGIYFIDKVGNLEGNSYDVYPFPRIKPKLPLDRSFDDTIYNIALTQDQVDVIFAIEKVGLKGGSVVITADRGRGKSAALGLGIAGLLHKYMDLSNNGLKIAITAPEPLNVKEVFNFVARALHKLGIKFVVRRCNHTIIELNSKSGSVKYFSPIDVLRERFDMIVVDEASGLPVNLLEGYIRKSEISIFSATLHGYEGAGRGFQIRFLPLLRKLLGDRLIEVNMSQPIRYSDLDPIENWLFKALLLDSDPADLSEIKLDIFRVEEANYVKIDWEYWLLNKKELLKQFIGIYIYAHYRNRPNDIMILSDAPHHFARCVTYNDYIINSLHLCYEGRLSDDSIRRTFAGEPPSGNLIPSVLIRYFPLYKDFANLWGIRIVRIATHPLLIDRGIGSKSLEYLITEFRDRVDWIGSSFGATRQLLNFWYKNGFLPVYLSPVRNPVSGEFSTIVIKPISKEARKYVKRIRFEFKKLFVESMNDSFFVLDEKLAWHLLSYDLWTFDYKPRLTKMGKERLKEYVYGALHYGGAYDVIKEIVKSHFIKSPNKRVPIPPKYEYILISKVLKAKSWERVSREFGIDKSNLIFKVREYISKMRLHYIKH